MDHPHQLAIAILDLFFEVHKLIGIGAIFTVTELLAQLSQFDSTTTMYLEYQFAVIPNFTLCRS